MALVTVLVRLGEPGGFEDDLLPTVLSQFGLALVTTLVGLLGRTTLLMGRTDDEDVAERAQASLEEACDEMTRSLRRVSAVAETFAGEFDTNLTSSLETVDWSIRHFKKMVDEASEAVSPVNLPLVELAHAVQDSVRDVRASGQALAADLSESSERVAAGIDAVHRQSEVSIQKLGSLAESSSKMLRGIQTQFERIFQDLQSSANSFDQNLSRTSNALEALPAQIEGVTTRADRGIEEAQRDVRDFYRQVDELLNGLRAISGSIHREGEGLSKTLTTWRQQADAIEAIHRKLLSEASGTTDAVLQVRAELAAGVDFLVENLTGQSEGRPK